MAAITAGTDVYPNTDKITDNVRGRIIQEVQCVIVELDSDVDATDTTTFDLSTLGGTTLLGIDGVSHQTANSVMIDDAPTTTVAGTTVTMTVPAGTDDDNRVYKLYFI